MKLLLVISLAVFNVFAGTQDTNSMTQTERTELYNTCSFGKVEQVQKFDETWNLNTSILKGDNCLFIATGAKNFEVALYLLNTYPQSIFYQARTSGNFFESTIDLINNAYYPLHNATADEFFIKAIDLWMNDVNSPVNEDINFDVLKQWNLNLLNVTLELTKLIDYDFLPAVKILIEKGASRYARGESELRFDMANAIYRNKPRLVEFFITLGDEVEGWHLQRAVSNKHLDILKLLVANGGYIHYSQRLGNLLHFAVNNPDLEILKYLLDLGVSKNQPDQLGMTPYDLAESSDFQSNYYLKNAFLNLLKL